MAEHIIPALAALWQRAERTALIRQLQALSGRSKVGRVMTQLGHQGRQLWSNLKTRRKEKAKAKRRGPDPLSPPAARRGLGRTEYLFSPTDG